MIDMNVNGELVCDCGSMYILSEDEPVDWDHNAIRVIHDCFDCGRSYADIYKVIYVETIEITDE